MKIRKFKEFKVECEECCEIHFNEDETFITNSNSDDSFEIMPYDEWLDLPLYRVLEFGGEDVGNWYSLIYKVWVICPECGQYHFVWYDRLYHILTQSIDDIKNIPLRQLIKENKVTLVKHLDFYENGVECVYGSEEEVIRNERS